MKTKPAPKALARTGPTTAEPSRRGLHSPLSSAFPPNHYVPAHPHYTPTTPPLAPAPPVPPAKGASQFPPAVAPQFTPAPGPSQYVPNTSASQYTPAQPTAGFGSPYTGFNQYNPGSMNTLSRVTDLPPPPPKKPENWNDPPMLANPARTRTPVPHTGKPPSPYTGASPTLSPGSQKSPAGPPPAMAKPPQRVRSPPMSPPRLGSGQFPPGPARPASTPYLPPTSVQDPLLQGPPRGPPPPSRPPTTRSPQPPPRPSSGQPLSQARSQYAPAPMQQQNSFTPQSSFPPAGPTASRPAPPPTRNQYAPIVSPIEAPSAPPQAKPTPPPAKFRMSCIGYSDYIASGDRSHIPASSRPIHDIFSNEMTRIKSLAQVLSLIMRLILGTATKTNCSRCG